MEVSIGIKNIARELTLETNLSADEVRDLVKDALNTGSPLELTDVRNRILVVPVADLGYISIGNEVPGRVGFGA